MHDSRTIQRFVRTLRGRYRWWNLGLAVLGHGLVVGVALCLVDLLAPGWLPVGAAAGAAWLALVAVWSAVRLRAPLAVADAQLGLRDRLLTYLGLPRQPAGRSTFAAWLEDDLERQLAALPEQQAARLWRRPLGRLRYLLPVLVLLLLLREFAPLPVHPSDRGPSMASGGGQGGGGTGRSDDGPPTGSDAGSDTQPDEQPEAQPRPEPEIPPELPPEPEDAQAAAPPPDEPPLPPPPDLDDLRVVDELVVPQFVGEGETRRQLARLALVQEGEGGAPPPPPPAGAGPVPPTPDDATDYRRARELALRARHVPPDERPFVAAYFDALLEAVR